MTCAPSASAPHFCFFDHQSRNDATGFQQNGDTGKLVHGMIGWDKLIIERMALYQQRNTSKPEAEARMWTVEGIAGGIGPWWHMVGAWHEDRRMYNTPERVFQWHKQLEQYLIDRRPLASVGVVWSQRNTDFFGRDNAADLVEAPYRGFTQALIRARIPYLPVNIDDDLSGSAVLILPNVGALSSEQCEAVRRFAQRGAIIASGSTSLYNGWGDAREDFALADLFGAHAPSEKPAEGDNSYLRVLPNRRERDAARRHPILRSFEETNIIPFGGGLAPMRTDPAAVVPLTFVPTFPAFPPETAWMRQPSTDIPGLVLNGRNAYLAADLDRRYARNNLPDHANLLENLVRWAAGDRIELEVKGPGLINCHLYRQPGRLILHVVNLTNEGTCRGPLDELIPVGPHEVRTKSPKTCAGTACNASCRMHRLRSPQNKTGRSLSSNRFSTTRSW